MYVKFALRNARRSIKDYLVYIVTLIICVALFYAFLSISSSFYRPDIGQNFNIETLGNWMKIAILLITLLLIFLIQYVNNFMFHQKQKEFAVQSIIGMEQGLTAWLFFLETLVIASFSLAAGILLGAVCSQFITAMLLQMFQKPFQFSFMLFPDTIILTIVFFYLCFTITGLFQVRTIRKIKIIDMLRSKRENENKTDLHKWINKIIIINLVFHCLMGVYNIRTLTYYFAPSFSSAIQFWCLGCIVVLWIILLISLLWHFFGKKKSRLKYLCLIEIIAVLETLFVGFLPILKTQFSLPMDTEAYNLYIVFLIWCIVFLVSVFFFLISKCLVIIKTNFTELCYDKENLFFFGQILSKLKTNTKTMAMICLTLTISISLFLLTPILVGWSQGFLDKRTPYDIQMYSGYSNVDDIEDLSKENYHLIDELLEKYEIEIADNCTFKTYFLKEEDFYEETSEYPITAISLSDYNHLMNMLGYEQISLADNEFATQ